MAEAAMDIPRVGNDDVWWLLWGKDADEIDLDKISKSEAPYVGL